MKQLIAILGAPANGGAVGEAPIDGKQYARKDGGWEEISSGTLNHSGLNLDDGTNPHGTTKSDVGLANVDNTSDANKPVSTAQQTALDGKASTTDLSNHIGDTNNPHSVTATQVGLGNVDDTSDADKPVSTATQAALDDKADKSNVLELDNTTAFTPTSDHEPATKSMLMIMLVELFLTLQLQLWVELSKCIPLLLLVGS